MNRLLLNFFITFSSIFPIVACGMEPLEQKEQEPLARAYINNYPDGNFVLEKEGNNAKQENIIRGALYSLEELFTPLELATKNIEAINTFRNGSVRVDRKQENELRRLMGTSSLGIENAENTHFYAMNEENSAYDNIFLSEMKHTWVNVPKYNQLSPTEKEALVIREGNYKAYYGPHLQVIVPSIVTTGLFYFGKNMFKKLNNNKFQKIVGIGSAGIMTMVVTKKATSKFVKISTEKTIDPLVNVCTYTASNDDTSCSENDNSCIGKDAPTL